MPTPSGTSVRDSATDALMALLAERGWAEISLGDIAEKAGCSLADLRDAFPSKGAILAAFSRRIDHVVLAGGGSDADMQFQPARERIFDVLMRRFDALTPYKAAVRSARSGLLRDPLAASSWNRVAVTSAQWMLAAAGVRESGVVGSAKAQALALLFARVLRTWLDDDEPGLSRTMRKLDHELRRAERAVQTSDMVAHTFSPFTRICRAVLNDRPSRRRARRSEDGDKGETEDPVTAI
jgi:AcrR family transcriptional regulator